MPRGLQSDPRLLHTHLSGHLSWRPKEEVLRASLVAQRVKNLPAHAGHLSLIPGFGRSLRGGNGNPLQYSYLENPMDRGAWQAAVLGVGKSWTRLKQLSTAHMWRERSEGWCHLFLVSAAFPPSVCHEPHPQTPLGSFLFTELSLHSSRGQTRFLDQVFSSQDLVEGGKWGMK